MNSTKTTDEKQQAKPLPETKPSPGKETADKEAAGKRPASGRKERRDRKKKNQTETGGCPMKILADILDKSSFKVPELSRSVEAKFCHDIDYKLHVGFLLSDIIYRPTVHEIADGDTPVSVLPSDVPGEVNLSPSAITDLNDIYHTFPSRWLKKNMRTKNKKAARNKPSNKAASPANGAVPAIAAAAATSTSGSVTTEKAAPTTINKSNRSANSTGKSAKRSH